MPYDENAYQNIEELGEGEKKRLDEGEEIDFSKQELRTRRNENIALVICLTISFVIFGFVLSGSS